MEKRGGGGGPYTIIGNFFGIYSLYCQCRVKFACFRYRQTGILSPASSPEQRRTRRKKNESPAGTDTHEYKPDIKHEYTHAAEYVTHDFRVHYAGAGATQHPAEMAAMQHYTMIPEHMLAQEYPQPVLL
ncbi:unnamed protein product [Haemonchus placei]|uniref:Aspzincin_M35 domain-containing protein n=1 Tax=Haemonchus placei TaxID=6290 RepID=A0A0N4W5K8_HAEPC|nr:unnamed protein product [Haemonchus placei]